MWLLLLLLLILLLSQVFPDRTRLHVVVAEHMRSRPNEVYEGLFRFIGAELPFTLHAEDEHVGRYTAPSMPERTRKKLAALFAPHNERLFDFLGYRIDEWMMPTADTEAGPAKDTAAATATAPATTPAPAATAAKTAATTAAV